MLAGHNPDRTAPLGRLAGGNVLKTLLCTVTAGLVHGAQT
jgi:hypothetical protein